MKLTYVTDEKRHLICVPYSVENLHIMALQLNINQCWFRKNHYWIPKRRVDEIEKLCKLVDLKNIMEIIKSPEYAKIIISDIQIGTASHKDHFWRTEIEYNGTDPLK